jgi:hypothetical protein
MYEEPTILNAIITSLEEARRRTDDRKERERLKRRIAQAKALANSANSADSVNSFPDTTPRKRTPIPPEIEQLCPLCGKAHSPRSAQVSRFCQRCRKKLSLESKETLLDMLGRIAAVNLHILSTVPIPPWILSRIAF